MLFQRMVGDWGFRCSPIEYLACWDQDPRLMSILEAIQSRWREKSADPKGT